ncbi:hypothetical protein [Denitromonas ohlonensis]|uniref:Uncharacterized protein n=2 Tax=Denitromonas TaxID=139331 RepID=A0A557RQZ2_9RHOO|nr:hypothetical protein [Denitromonas ohlonensis]TVO67587.1 hypothetical protein FHP90_06395 [Denitromonas ohlonensis]TVO76445.1 hypothetical protein FHP89_10090 [Denitromonas ohlonensis]
MNLDAILGVINLLLYWRVAVCLVVSSVTAFLLVQAFPWLSGLQGIAFAALGMLAGIVWEETAHPSSTSAVDAPPTSTVVAVLSAAIFGAVWGGMSSTSFQSALAGAVVLIGGVWGWFRFAVASRGWLTREQGIICILVSATAYPFAALMAHRM